MPSAARSRSSARTTAAITNGVPRLNATERITTPESFTSVPITPTVSAQIAAGRIVGLCSYSRSSSDARHFTG
ncbi:hypothetical protein, partial [Actinomadura rubrobrunea]|uniref:hypothetical protein n=1 Tax=Actinomadura rubrobrunea TaxID=115335 RepID=UPI0012FAD361